MSFQTMSLDRGEMPIGPSPSSPGSTSRTKQSNSTSTNIATTTTTVYASSSIMREQTTETSIKVLIWHSNPSNSNPSALSNANLFREVPQVKKKLTRNKDRESVGSGMIVDVINGGNSIAGPSDPKILSSIKNATPTWLREKPSKTKLGGNSSAGGHQKPQGQWKRATVICRETGVLLIYGEDRAMLHSLSATGLSVNDVRLVDDSLFNRPHVLGIFANPSTLTTGSLREQGKTSKNTKSNSLPLKMKEDPIYLCFPTSRKLYMWRGLLSAFARPEIYGPLNAMGRKHSHRSYRHIDMSIHEVKIFAEKSSIQERSRRVSGVLSPPPAENDDSTSMATIAIANSASGFGNDYSSSNDHASITVKRSSLDAPIRNVSSVIGKLTIKESGEKRDDVTIESRSISSADELGDAPSGPTFVNASLSNRQAESIALAHHLAPDMERRGSDSSSHNIHSQLPSPHLLPSSCLCQVWMNGEVIGRTKVANGTSSIAWFDKFAFQDLPRIGMMFIEVLQSWRPGKYVLLGSVDLPVEVMRRGEKIEGWFPVWSPPKTEEAWSKRDENAASYGREVMGELKISMNIYEETILPSHRYAEIDQALNGPGCVALMRRLCKELEEDKVISYLVDVYTCGGTIVNRLSDLINAESSTFTGEPTLLFRGNTLLSRAIDKYQRRYCIDWLESCVGDTIRRVCSDRIRIEMVDLNSSPSITGVVGNSSGHVSQTSTDANLATLRSLSQDLWKSIYSNRHNCPPDLRRALASVRKTVNSHFKQSPGPGVQGVGAFVFLRLICPAITSPNLYGLMGSTPDPQSARTLMLLAKVFLALANKKISFDKDKEPWLTKMNDFLVQQASAYDDFITIVSTEAEIPTKVEPIGDEKDQAFQRLLKVRIDGLNTLHRESIPRPGLRLDHPLAMAMLISHIVREASADSYEENGFDYPTMISTGLASPTSSNNTTFGKKQMDQMDEKAELMNDFIDLCCDLEDQVGYHIDRAGYNPEPLPIASHDGLSGVHRTTSIFAARKGGVGGGGGQSSPSIGVPFNTPILSPTYSTGQLYDSMNAARLRRATVSEGKVQTPKNEMPQMSYLSRESFLRQQSEGAGQNSMNALHSMDEEGELNQTDDTKKVDTIDTRYDTVKLSSNPIKSRQSDDIQQFRRRSDDLERMKRLPKNENNVQYDDHFEGEGINGMASIKSGGNIPGIPTFSPKKKRGWWRRKK